MWLTSCSMNLALHILGRARSSDQIISWSLNGSMLSYVMFPSGCFCVLWGIKLIVGNMPSFTRITPTLVCVLACVWVQEGRTIILVWCCEGTWNSQCHSSQWRCLPRGRRIHCLGCWQQRLYNARRHLLWRILTIIFIFPSTPRGSH